MGRFIVLVVLAILLASYFGPVPWRDWVSGMPDPKKALSLPALSRPIITKPALPATK